ncbi:MAG TPA: hypothetical protein VLT16_14520, partial [Candidatus Limnocylindrales bacterium]|nr:hypothetical protein [Candidatus Limnocylindrales bacterium]
MKDKFLVAVVVFASICIVAASAQQAPNLENGFKDYGSYDGGHLDTVNLMNGNLMLHVPLLPVYAQRGSFAPQYSLYMTSKGWQTQCKPMSTSSTGEVCWWQTSGAGVMVISGEGLLIQRTLLRSFSGTGQTLYNMQNYTVTGPDASVHRFMAVPGAPLAPTGDPTVYESMDASGYHIVISNPDLNGVMSGVTVTDRQGRQYTGAFDTDYSTTTGCGRPGIVGIPQVGNYAPVTDDVPFGDQYCPQWAPAQQVTDSNGNQMQFGITRINPPLLTDTLGRSMPFTFTPASPATADPAKCVIPATGVLSATDLIYYNAPDGTAHYLQRCYASMPIQTAFGIPDVA